jgi:DNA-binding transcriptional LysR family regulator
VIRGHRDRRSDPRRHVNNWLADSPFRRAVTDTSRADAEECLHRLSLSKGKPAMVRVTGNLITNSGETIRTVALDGTAVCLARGFLVHDDLESGRLVRLLPEYRPIEFSMNAIYPHRHHLSAKVRTFIDMLAYHASERQKLIDPYS